MGVVRIHSAFQAWFHVQCDLGAASQSGPLSLVLRLTTRRVGVGWSRYDIDEDQNPVLVPTSSLKHPAIFRRSEDVITCIWPAEYCRSCT